MHKTLLSVVGVGVALVLGGCAAQVVSSTPKSVVVKARIQDAAEANTLAEAECKKNGLSARFAGKSGGNQYFFDCVN